MILRLHLAALVFAMVLLGASGCSSPPSSSVPRSAVPRSGDATAQAQYALEEFFVAYGNSDVERFNELVDPRQKTDELSITRLVVESIEPLPSGPDDLPSYKGPRPTGSPDVEHRAFKAPIRLWGPSLVVDQGQLLDWTWWVVRGADGEWRVYGWGANE